MTGAAGAGIARHTLTTASISERLRRGVRARDGSRGSWPDWLWNGVMHTGFMMATSPPHDDMTGWSSSGLREWANCLKAPLAPRGPQSTESRQSNRRTG